MQILGNKKYWLAGVYTGIAVTPKVILELNYFVSGKKIQIVISNDELL